MVLKLGGVAFMYARHHTPLKGVGSSRRPRAANFANAPDRDARIKHKANTQMAYSAGMTYDSHRQTRKTCLRSFHFFRKH